MKETGTSYPVGRRLLGLICLLAQGPVQVRDLPRLLPAYTPPPETKVPGGRDWEPLSGDLNRLAELGYKVDHRVVEEYREHSWFTVNTILSLTGKRPFIPLDLSAVDREENPGFIKDVVDLVREARKPDHVDPLATPPPQELLTFQQARQDGTLVRFADLHGRAYLVAPHVSLRDARGRWLLVGRLESTAQVMTFRVPGRWDVTATTTGATATEEIADAARYTHPLTWGDPLMPVVVEASPQIELAARLGLGPAVVDQDGHQIQLQVSSLDELASRLAVLGEHVRVHSEDARAVLLDHLRRRLETPQMQPPHTGEPQRLARPATEAELPRSGLRPAPKDPKKAPVLDAEYFLLLIKRAQAAGGELALTEVVSEWGGDPEIVRSRAESLQRALSDFQNATPGTDLDFSVEKRNRRWFLVVSAAPAEPELGLVDASAADLARAGQLARKELDTGGITEGQKASYEAYLDLLMTAFGLAEDEFGDGPEERELRTWIAAKAAVVIDYASPWRHTRDDRLVAPLEIVSDGRRRVLLALDMQAAGQPVKSFLLDHIHQVRQPTSDPGQRRAVSKHELQRAARSWRLRIAVPSDSRLIPTLLSYGGATRLGQDAGYDWLEVPVAQPFQERAAAFLLRHPDVVCADPQIDEHARQLAAALIRHHQSDGTTAA